ncbi:response regulator transcription factor [Lentisphaerota bacterium ZTH]|nr:response regulator transcription factor [Lentisphaerota bacterium]WET06106.1 response regulator transcription factor [Lentisphaerota bacterium ZTH]
MAKEKILIIEDEEDIQELIRYNLKKEGFENLKVADSGEKGLKIVPEFMPDIILLDLMLPGMDGLAVCRTLKSNPETEAIPIIMLTAKSEETDVIIGLEMGADDYITKPFSTKVLVARIKSVVRRSRYSVQEETPELLKRGSLLMNRGKREATINDEPVQLTFSEFEILYMLAKRPGWVFTRNQIVNEVKGDDYPVTERAVDVQIVGLRKKLGEMGKLIETVRGVGYRFNENI